MIDVSDRLDSIIERMRACGQRMTPQRMAILKFMIGNPSHPSVDQIYEQVKTDFPMTSLATVYKTVAVLTEMGEVQELGFTEGGNRYDGSGQSPHPHLICIRCRRIIDVEDPALNNISVEVARRTGYRITGYQFDLFGICPACQEQD